VGCRTITHIEKTRQPVRTSQDIFIMIFGVFNHSVTVNESVQYV